MKIAFVGKGGSGKTTVSSSFAHYLSFAEPVLAIDADINMHMAELLGGVIDPEQIISERDPSERIRSYLIGTNPRIASTAYFKKSTPPGAGSRLIAPSDSSDWFMQTFTQPISDSLRLATVGTYSEEGIASSCYHNNLAILENVLSHTTDEGSVVVDMVAGTDAFASTLFAQFDALFFVAEPTTRSLAVYEQYLKLAQSGGVADRLFVVGNKIEDDDDRAFVRSVVGDRLIAGLSRSSHILAIDKGRAILDAHKLSSADSAALEHIRSVAGSHTIDAQARLQLLWKLHKIYVSQGYVADKFGDLTTQIDPTFVYPERHV